MTEFTLVLPDQMTPSSHVCKVELFPKSLHIFVEHRSLFTYARMKRCTQMQIEAITCSTFRGKRIAFFVYIVWICLHIFIFDQIRY